MRTNAHLLAVGLTAFTLFSAMSCDEDPVAPPCPDLALVATFADTTYANEAIITSAERQGDCLLLTGQYGGGCVEDNLRASAQKSPLAVYPPIYVVTLYDDAPDTCQALVPGSAAFSLATVRAEDPQFDLRFAGLDDVVIEVR